MVKSPITYGAENAEILSGKVTGQSGDGYPQGTVTVKNGTTTLCSQTAIRQWRQRQLQLCTDSDAVGCGQLLERRRRLQPRCDLVFEFDDQLCDVDLDAAQELHGEPGDEVDHDLAACGDLAHHRWRRDGRGLQWHGHRSERRWLPGGHGDGKSGTTTLCSEALPVGSGDSTAFSCSLTASQLGAGTYSIDAIFTPATTSSSSAHLSYTGSASAPLQSLTVKASTASSNNLQMQLSSPGLVSGVGGIYLVTVINHASTASSGTLTITDALPAGLSYKGILTIPQGWRCTSSGGTGTCTSSVAIPAHGADYLFLAVNVSARAGTSITNKVTLAPVGTPASNYAATITTKVAGR